MFGRWISPSSVRCLLLAILAGALSSGEMVRRFPGWTSVHFFVGTTAGMVSWTILTWSYLAIGSATDRSTGDYVEVEVDIEESGNLAADQCLRAPYANLAHQFRFYARQDSSCTGFGSGSFQSRQHCRCTTGDSHSKTQLAAKNCSSLQIFTIWLRSGTYGHLRFWH